MNENQILEALDHLLRLPPGTLKGNELLESLDGWDSLAIIEFVAMADEDFGVDITAEEVRKSKRVQDLVMLLGARV